MKELILFVIATVGLTWIIVQSTILKTFREMVSRNSVKNFIIEFISKLINCAGCTGFWAGGIVFLLMYFHIEILVYCFAGAGASFGIITYFNFIQRK